jgi:hypothetical protein
LNFKKGGNPLYLVGKETKKEMGGSEYYKIIGIEGGKVPRTESDTLKKSKSRQTAILDALIKYKEKPILKYNYHITNSNYNYSNGNIGVAVLYRDLLHEFYVV